MAEGAGDGPLRYYKSSEAIIYFSFCCTAPGRAVCLCMHGGNNKNDSYTLVTAHCMPLYKFFDALISQIYRQTADIFPQKLFH